MTLAICLDFTTICKGGSSPLECGNTRCFARVGFST